MKLLFVSSLYPVNQKESFSLNCKRGASLQNQVDAFQWAMLEGLVKNGVDFQAISFPTLGTYPLHFNKLFVPASDIVYEGKYCGTSLKYSALMIYKEWDIQRGLKNYVERWIDESNICEKEPLVVLVYTSASVFVESLVKLKQRHRNLFICCVITDLIDDAMNFDSNRMFLKRIQIAREKNKQKNLYKDIDFFVLLTQGMEEKIPEAIGKNIVIEGIYGKHKLPEVQSMECDDRLKTILYGGTLQEFSGVKELLNAFMLLHADNYRLVICGSGFCSSYIKQCVQKDSRIDYKGVISREELLLLQRNATLLVNPRKPTEDITRFSFPSKTIEYLSSGTPMLGYKLEGIPAEYYDYFYMVDDLTTQGLADKLQDVLNLSDEERHLMAEKARHFICQSKTAEYQMRKLLSFLKLRLA